MQEFVQIGSNADSSEQLNVDKETRKKVYIRTYGCQMNEYDSLKLEKILEPNYELVKDAERADLILVNTCSVRDKPEQKLYSLLGQIRELKKDKPNLMVGVGGCVAQQEGEKIVKKSKVVDFVFGTHNLSLVPALINQRENGASPQVAIDYREEWEELPAGFVENGRVSTYISISRGCNKNCTYCIVPTTRGKEVSRPINEIEREVKLAVHRGAKEVVLLGQTVNSYGLDLSPRGSFRALLENISKIEGVKRIRFTSPHPQEIRMDFIELVTQNEKICRHIHMPLQSGSDRILKAMNRNYRIAKYLKIINDLKSRVPDISITTDIIVGFPGESESDFEETLAVIESVQFDNVYSFAFSPRPGTVAAAMPDHLPLEVRMNRLQVLQAKQDQITTIRLNQWAGKEVEVLLDSESESESNFLSGRISQNIRLNLTHSAENLKKGDIINARVSEVMRYTLRGEALSKI